VRVGLLGLTTPNIPGWELPEHYRGLVFVDPEEAARRWVPVLRGAERCDLVVVLAHTGFERSPSTGEPSGTAHEDYGWRIAQVPGIDVLLTGHTHRDIPPQTIGGVIVAQPSSRARRLTRVDLDLERGEAGWRLAGWRGENLKPGDAAVEAWFGERFADLHRRVVETLDGPLTTVDGPVSVDGCRVRDCAALDLVHAVQLDASGADLSLAALLSNRTPDLGPGPVTWRWVHALYVYPNTLHRIAVTGAQVKDLLEHTARYYDGLDCAPGGGCTVATDPSIPQYNVDSMAGVTYRIDPTRPEGDRVRDLRRHGRPVSPDDRFTLVVNSYRASGGGMFPHLADAPVEWRTPIEMTDLIGDWLARQQLWRPTVDGNWSLAPDVTEREAAASGS
jgi:2',3'-cyclic-nucleotide 2'-phosphodiesterase/3'-nucleotidase